MVNSRTLEPLFMHLRELRDDLVLDGSDRFYPRIKPGGDVLLHPDETILWRGRTFVSELRYTCEFDDYDQLWRLPETAEITVTNRRIAFVCAKWEIGGGWTSYGTAPITTMLLNAASKARTAVLRRGTVAVGHVRWEWPARLIVVPGLAASGGFGRKRSTERPAGLMLCNATPQKVIPGHPTLHFFGGDLTGSHEEPCRVGNIIFQAIIDYRLSHAERLGVTDEELAAAAQRAETFRFSTDFTGEQQQVNLPGLLLTWFMDPEEYNGPNVQSILNREE